MKFISSKVYYGLLESMHMNLELLNNQYFWKWTNANPMKIFSRAATTSKLQIRLKLSLGELEIKFPSEEQDLVSCRCL